MTVNSKSCLRISADPRDHMVFTRVLLDLVPRSYFILADNALDALNFLEGASIIPDYIFVEIDEAGIDGVEFLREAKRSPLLQNIPAIVHSAEPMPDKVKSLKELGALAIYFRPYNYAGVSNLLKICFKDGLGLCLN